MSVSKFGTALEGDSIDLSIYARKKDVQTLSNGLNGMVSKIHDDIEDLHQNVEDLHQNVETVSKMEGPRGQRGPQGEVGSQGSQGVQGIQGDKGERGIQGLQGVKATVKEIIGANDIITGGFERELTLSGLAGEKYLVTIVSSIFSGSGDIYIRQLDSSLQLPLTELVVNVPISSPPNFSQSILTTLRRDQAVFHIGVSREEGLRLGKMYMVFMLVR